MYQQRQKNVSAMIFHMYQGENGIKTHLVHQRVRISSLRQSLYPVYDAIRWFLMNYTNETAQLNKGASEL